MPESTDTETLAEVLADELHRYVCTDPDACCWSEEGFTCAEVDLSDFGRALAARIEQARAGETALREAAANAVRRFHRCTTLEGVAAACWEGDCDHPECHNGGESPVREFKVCKHCADLAEESGLMEESWPAWIMWPCATAVAVGFADQATLAAALDTTGGTP